MNCPKCHKPMVKRLVFVSRGALIKGYNFGDDSELKTVDGILGMDVEEIACEDCNIYYSMAGGIIPYDFEEKQ
jgi:uncharacterized protein YbaR (Trm112 family)